MKKTISISIFLIGALFSTAQSNMDFEQWVINYNGIDETKHWLNTSDASEYGAPPTIFKEVEHPASGLSSIILTTSYWEIGSPYGLDTLVGSLVQQATYSERPKSFEFSYKSFPQPGDEILVGVQLTMMINDSTIVIGEGFFTASEIQENWEKKKVDINYYASYTPENINIIALSSANAVLNDGSEGYAKIGSTLYLDNLRLNVEGEEIKNEYFIHVFPNPANSHINVETNSPEMQLIEIYSLAGKKVLSSTFNLKSKIDISSLPSGTYVYQVVGLISNEVTASNKFNVIR